MKRKHTIIIRSDCEEDIEAIERDILRLIQKWDEEVVSYNGGQTIN
jgi:hypothetical protein